MEIYHNKDQEEIVEEITEELQENIRTINNDHTYIAKFNIEKEEDMLKGITRFKYTVSYLTPNILSESEKQD